MDPMIRNKLLEPVPTSDRSHLFDTGAPAGMTGNALTGYTPAPTAPPAPPAAPGIDHARLAADWTRIGDLRNDIGELLQKKNPTSRDLTGMITNAVAKGTLTPQDAHRELMGAPVRGSATQIGNWAADQYLTLAHVHHVGHAFITGQPMPSSPSQGAA